MQVEKIIMEAKLEGARSQAKLDADVMTSTLNVERSRWRARFSVIEDNVSKRQYNPPPPPRAHCGVLGRYAHHRWR